MNTNKPLGLPTGSVRSILALLVVGAFVIVETVALIAAALAGLLDPMKVFDAGFQLAMLIVTAYFVSRTNGSPG